MSSCKKKKISRTLAIIGNGFDIAHGYHTGYQSFVENTSSPSLDIFKAYCQNESSIKTWYLFEENIRTLTGNLFAQSYSEDCDYDANRAEVSHLRDVFKEIHDLLIHYLDREIKSKPVTKLPAVKKYLKPKTKVINFNYTGTAEAYTKNIFYVHGSLKENDILLGYDYRDEPCLAQYEDMCWSKTICREALAFRRFLKSGLGLDPGSSEYEKLISSLEAYQHCENSGRGVDLDLEAVIPDFHLVDHFLQDYKKRRDIPDFDYPKISTIVVMGHGIEADQVFLKKILARCTRLKKVVIYRYHGESDSSFEKKADFFRPYCKKIRCVFYKNYLPDKPRRPVRQGRKCRQR